MDLTQRLRCYAAEIFQAGLQAVDPVVAVKRRIRRDGQRLMVDGRCYELNRYGRMLVVGTGKASAAMAVGLEAIVGDRVEEGLINVKYGHTEPLRRIGLHQAGHPIPDAAGVAGTQKIVALANAAGSTDLLMCLISGGGSALLPLPVADITLTEKQATTQLLLECGATIHEINTIRKHISQVKGGRLARRAAPATVLTLILSDVVGDDLDVIASGPTVPDRSTFQEALAIVTRYDCEDRVPPAVRDHLQAGARGLVAETPKAGDPVFQKVHNVLVGNNFMALEAAAQRARRLGLNSLILSSMVEGETREIAKIYSAMAREIHQSGHPVPKPACIISGGETTVTIRGRGCGGRNQEFVLAAALGIAEQPATVVFSAGTDGTDGPTDAAGAVADGDTLRRSQALGLDPQAHLEDNNSYPFFKALGDLVMTGPTKTNVMDLRLLLVAD